MLLKRCASVLSVLHILPLLLLSAGCGGRAIDGGGSPEDAGTSTAADAATSVGSGGGCPDTVLPACINGCSNEEVSPECKDGQWQCPPEPPCLPPPPPEDAGMTTTTIDAGSPTGVACGKMFCTGGTFCELINFSSGGIPASLACEPVPPACQNDVSCTCLMNAHAYSCVLPAAPVCEDDGDGGISMGCLAH